MKSRIIKAISLTLAIVSITLVIGIALILEPGIKLYGMAELDEARLNNIKNTLVIFDSEGKSTLPKAFTPIDEISPYAIDAFVCAEDKRFYEHEGVDYYRIAAAIIKNIANGAYSQGASTITQQLIKNSHLSSEKTINRKIQEIRLSRELERKYSKKEILEMYLNILYFGNGVYGIGNAARSFFGKTPSKLTLRESAMLAAIINNPGRYNPYEHNDRLNERADLILKLIKDENKITDTEYESALSEAAQFKDLSLGDKYNYFVIKEATEILGCTEEHLIHGDYKIISACDKSMQNEISYILNNCEAESAQIIVIDNLSGEILAHQAKYKGDPAYIMRSPGSIIKPIVSYAPALEKNLIVPITPILDERTNFDGYNPANYKDNYYGWVSCKYALKESLNIPAVKLTESVGLSYAKSFASDMGIDTDDEGLALSLGGMKKGVSLKALASAYSVFARGGSKINCSYIKAIYRDDELIYSAPKTEKQVMSHETAYFINEMLNECAISGTAKKLNATEFNVAAKTGTVGNKDGNSDSYCLAYTPSITIGVHIMENNGVTTGGGLPTKIVKSLIMSHIISNDLFEIPANICKIDINANEYYKNHRIIQAERNLKKKDRITASFIKNRPPEMPDERSDYERNSESLDMNNFTIIDGFFD